MCREDPLIVRYRGCGHTIRLIVGTRPNCTGHCHTDQAFLDFTQLAPRARSNRRLCPSCHSDSAAQLLPVVIRRPAPAHRVIVTPFEEGVYAYHSCLCRWRRERYRHEAGQQVKGRAGLEDETWEERMRGVRELLEYRRRNRVYREEPEEDVECQVVVLFDIRTDLSPLSS